MHTLINIFTHTAHCSHVRLLYTHLIPHSFATRSYSSQLELSYVRNLPTKYVIVPAIVIIISVIIIIISFPPLTADRLRIFFQSPRRSHWLTSALKLAVPGRFQVTANGIAEQKAKCLYGSFYLVCHHGKHRIA